MLQGVAASVLLSSCSGDKPPPPRQVSPDDPFGVPDGRPLEIVVYDDGHDWARYSLDLLAKKHPKTSGRVSAVQGVRADTLSRLENGVPPDVIGNSGPDKLINTQDLVDNDRLADLRPLIDAPSWDDPGKTVRDTLAPGVVESGSYDGVPRLLNYVRWVYAFWYSSALFDRFGWEPPKTWDELLALGAVMKRKKLPLVTYDGVNPQSVLEPVLTLAAKQGGAAVLKNLDNLEDGAWKQDSLTKAAAAFGELAGRGLVLPGSKGLAQPEARARFYRAKAGVLPSGNWLEPGTPKGFGLTALAVPPLDGSARLPNGVHVAPGEAFVVPEKAPNKAAGMEFLRALLSKQAAVRYTEQAGALTVLAGSADGLDLKPGLKSADALVSGARDQVVNWFFGSWYPGLGTAAADATGALMAGAIESKEWAERIQRTADDLKRDPKVTKYRRD